MAIAVAFFGGVSSAQTLSDDGGAIAAGQAAFDRQDYAGAISVWQKALPALAKAGDSRTGYVQAAIGRAYYQLADVTHALTALQQAADIDRTMHNPFGEAQDLGNIGYVQTALSRFDDALASNERALGVARTLQKQPWGASDRAKVASMEANDLTNLGNVLTNLGRYDEAAADYESALTIFRAGGSRLEEAQDLGNAGLIEQRRGRFDAALEHLDQALAIARALSNTFEEAVVLESLGNVEESLGRFDDALATERQALAAFRIAPAPGGTLDIERSRGEEQTLLNVGNLEDVMGRPSDALATLQPALPIARGIGDKLGEADTLSSIAIADWKLARYPAALDLLEQSLTIHQAIKYALGEAIDLNAIGVVDANLGRYSEARNAAGAALVLDRRLAIPARLCYSLQLAAGADAHLGHREAALAEYAEAVDEIERLRASLAGNERSGFLRTAVSVYDDYVAYLLELDRRYPGKGYDRKALEIFERKSARSSLEQIGRSAALHFRGVAADVPAREESAQHAVDGTQSLLTALLSNASADRAALAAAQRDAARARTVLAGIEASIRTRYPAYYALRHPQALSVACATSPCATIAKFQRSVLAPGELLLVYDVLAGHSALWLIDRQRVTLVPLPGSDAIDAGVERVGAHVAAISCSGARGARLERSAAGDIPEFAGAAHALYDLLIPAAARAAVARAKSLIVVPSGSLYRLSFETLVTRGAAGQVRPHYLIEDVPISYMPSASLLAVVRASFAHGAAARSPLLAVANPAFGRDDAQAVTAPTYAGLQLEATRSTARGASGACAGDAPAASDAAFPALPGTQTEADAVRAVLEAPAAGIVAGEDATRAHVLALNAAGGLKKYRYVLFATHAVLPSAIEGLTQPAIVLAHPERGDGLLTMADVFGLSLDADFVALSACNTGVASADTGGEGISGLTRAFLYAGTPAISVTLWEVDDAAAPQITPRLFAGMSAGKDTPAEALRRAKLALLDSPEARFRHPYAWGPSVIFGDGDRARAQ